MNERTPSLGFGSVPSGSISLSCIQMLMSPTPPHTKTHRVRVSRLRERASSRVYSRELITKLAWRHQSSGRSARKIPRNEAYHLISHSRFLAFLDASYGYSVFCYPGPIASFPLGIARPTTPYHEYEASHCRFRLAPTNARERIGWGRPRRYGNVDHTGGYA